MLCVAAMHAHSQFTDAMLSLDYLLSKGISPSNLLFHFYSLYFGFLNQNVNILLSLLQFGQTLQ